MASCLACEEGTTVEEYCADPRHSDVVGCSTPRTPGTSPSGADSNASSRAGCEFETEPVTPYFWDEGCNPSGLGCLADGVHARCRFCGGGAYASIPCPSCAFPGAAPGPHYWDNACRANPGLRGCLADGVHQECRRCGSGEFSDVRCPSSIIPAPGACAFRHAPATPHYWEPKCKRGIMGCWADGVHAECRWCGKGPYRSIPCPR